MNPTKANAGVLVLEDGSEFPGILFGAKVSADALAQRTGAHVDRGYGEVVFNTSLTGYQEILTDPSYYGQMVCMTNPHIGNTGVNAEDPESAKAWAAGFIVHQGCEIPSNWRSQKSLESYLVEYGIPGLCEVDTRALTRRLRSAGVIRGVILPAAEKGRAAELLKKLPPFEGRDLIGEVTTRETYAWKKPPESPHGGKQKPLKIVAMDFGIKHNLLNCLRANGCETEIVPANATAAQILEKKPDGVFLSNGPGDPAMAPYAAETVKGLLGKTPIFGVCMGHQILALALGGKTYKLKFGHRGGNQPVLDKQTGKVEISSHNHGYAVDAGSLPANVEVTHLNLNDKTVEGLAVPSMKAFSVQYHPEACPGPHDSEALFKRFVEMIRTG